jgi:nucleoside-diphosphate-sugar epimerase
MKKILIVGSKGFLGKNIKKKLKTKHKIFELNRQNGDYTKDYSVNKFKNIDIIICAAGIVGVKESWVNPFYSLKSNYLGTLNLLEFCRKNNSKLIFISSYLYGDNNNLPTSENTKLSFTNPYDLSKKLCDDLCVSYNQLFNTNVIILRTFNIYGPKQNKKFLIPNIINQAKKNKTIKLYNFNSKRDFLYIDDFLNAIMLLVDYKKSFQIFNLGSQKSYSNYKLANIILNLMNKKKDIQEICFNHKEVAETLADITKISKELKWKPKISIKEGLLKVLKA